MARLSKEKLRPGRQSEYKRAFVFFSSQIFSLIRWPAFSSLSFWHSKACRWSWRTILFCKKKCILWWTAQRLWRRRIRCHTFVINLHMTASLLRNRLWGEWFAAWFKSGDGSKMSARSNVSKGHADGSQCLSRSRFDNIDFVNRISYPLGEKNGPSVAACRR